MFMLDGAAGLGQVPGSGLGLRGGFEKGEDRYLMGKQVDGW
jgi:hypothetical protein